MQSSALLDVTGKLTGASRLGTGSGSPPMQFGDCDSPTVTKVGHVIANARTLQSGDDHCCKPRGIGVLSLALRTGAFSPARLLQARRAGAHIGGVGSNVLQGRGTFVVNRSGRVVYRQQAVTAADIPPIGEIVSVVRQAA